MPSGSRSVRILALAVLVDGNGSLVTLFDGPDDVLRTKRGIAAEKHPGVCGVESQLVDDRHAPLVEVDAKIALDPGKCVFLTDGEHDVVGRHELFAGDLLGGDPPPGIQLVFHDVEQHALELATFADEGLGRTVDDDLDVLFLGVLEFPGRSLEELARLAGDDPDALRAKPHRCAAAIHGRIADTDDQHLLADGLDVLESHRLEPGDADMHMCRIVITTRTASVPCHAVRRCLRKSHRSPRRAACACSRCGGRA
jgi:hypothetical protein